MQINVFYSERYNIDIGPHVFPTVKYDLIKKRLEETKELRDKISFVEVKPAGSNDLLLVHTKEYLDKLNKGTLSSEEIFRLELPYSKEIIDGSILCCGGTMACSEIALGKKIALHLGGGFHHAFPDHGEGFCVLNDVAIAVKKLKGDKKINRALIVDCDLHQGNGTAAIFYKDEDVFTFSIHQQNNYPFVKPKSDLDIGLPDRTEDRRYLDYLKKHIPLIIDRSRPDLIVYLAGADPYKDDQIGGLALTMDGLKERDEFIYGQALDRGVALSVVLAGGYAWRLEDTVEIHFNTVASAVKMFGG